MYAFNVLLQVYICYACAKALCTNATPAESTLYTIRVVEGETRSHQQDQQRHHIPSSLLLLPTMASHTSLNARYHMTGILTTQQEVALQTVCFAPFLKL